MLSTQTKYALRAMLYLLEQQKKGRGFTALTELSQKTNTPGSFLSKIMKTLAQQNLVVTKKGVNGGVMLPPEKPIFTFWEIGHALNDPLTHDECILFKAVCDKENPCDFHKDWSLTKQKFKDFLKQEHSLVRQQ